MDAHLCKSKKEKDKITQNLSPPDRQLHRRWLNQQKPTVIHSYRSCCQHENILSVQKKGSSRNDSRWSLLCIRREVKNHANDLSLSLSLFHLKQGCTVGIKKMKIITVIAISWFDICYCMEGKRAKFHQQSNRRHLIFSFACRTPQDLLTETFNLSEWIFTACVSILKLKDL